MATELIGPGERKALFVVPVDVGKPPKQVLRHVEDMRQYFLVWDTPFDGGGDQISNAHKADRTRVSSYTIDGFDASINLPGSANDIIAKIADDLMKNATATALFQGFASGKKSAEENKTLASARITLVEEMVFDKAHQSSIVSHGRFIEDPDGSTKKDAVKSLLSGPASNRQRLRLVLPYSEALLRSWYPAFQEFDLPVVVGFMFGDVKPFRVVVR